MPGAGLGAAVARMSKIRLPLTSWEDGNLRTLLQYNEIRVATCINLLSPLGQKRTE